MQRSKDRSCTVPFYNQMITRKPAAIFYQPVDAGIIQWPDHDVHRLGHQSVGEGAEFPIAEMRGGEQNAASGLFRFEIVLQAFVADPLMYVLAIELGKAREHPDKPRDGAENFVNDGPALGDRF